MINHRIPALGLLLLIHFGMSSIAVGQRTDPRQNQKRLQEQMRAAAENQPQLPSDPVLLNLHKEFIAKAEKLYQNNRKL